jgi:type IV secretory pathway VirJ component
VRWRTWIGAAVAAAGALGAAPAAAQQPPLGGLPLVEVPATAPRQGDLIAVLLTADGGWAALDRGVAADLANSGIPVVGWSSLAYYRTPRTPDQAAADLARVLRHYLPAWGGRRVMLIGYSFGADVLPLLVNRLPDDLRSRVAGVALIGFSPSAVFEFHMSEWLGMVRGRQYPTLPEVRRLTNVPILCVYGQGDHDEACGQLGMQNATVVAIASGHKMGSVSGPVGEVVVRQARELLHAAGAPGRAGL